MNRSALLLVLLVGLLVAQGSAYAVVGSSGGTGTAEYPDEGSSNVQSAFPDSVFADSHNSSGDDESDGPTATTATTEDSNEGSEDSESGTANESGASGSSTDEEETTAAANNEDEDSSDATTAVDDEGEEDTTTTSTTNADVDEEDSTTTAATAADADEDDEDAIAATNADEGADTTTAADEDTTTASSAESDEETTSEAGSDGAASDRDSEDTPDSANASDDGGAEGESGSEEGDTDESDTTSETTALPETADLDIEVGGASSGADSGTDGGAAPDEGTPSGTTPSQAPSGGTADAGGTSDDQAAATANGGTGGSGAQTGGAEAGAASGQAPSGQTPADQAPSGAQAPGGGQAPAGQAPGSAQDGQAPGGAAAGNTAAGGGAAGKAPPSGAATPGGATPGGAAAGGGAAPSAGAAAGGQGAGAGGAQDQQGQQGAAGGSSDADFDVVDSSLDASIGASGTLTVELENDGEDAENAVVNLQSQDGALTFGGSASASQFVGEWEEGETRTVEVDASIAPGTDQRSYPVQASVAYENDDGNQVQSSPVSFGVTPGDEQDFALDSVDSSLSAGDRGTISGTITNEGPADAESAVLVFAGNGSVIPRQSEVVLGDLGDDESTDFVYPVAVRGGAPPGERQVPFVVQYQDEEGNTVRSERLNARVEIDEADADFAVTDVDSELEPGETGIVEVTLENQGESVTDATVSLQSISPNIVFGQAANTSVFVGDWNDGDTKTVEVQATATGTATEGEYPVQASIAYTEEDNDQAPRAGPITFGVEVGDSDDDFAVTDVDSDLEPGGSGTVEVTLENEDEDLTDATVSLQTLSPAITFGQAANASVFVGEWEEGETRTIDVRASVAQDATEGEYPVQASVSYTEADDNRRGQAGPFAFGATVGQSADDFAVTNVNSTVPIGDQGTVRVTLRNDEENATESTVSLRSLSADLSLGPAANATQFVGDWDEGERRTVAFEVTASNRTERRSYPFQTSVSYTDTGNQRTQDGPYTIGVQPLREQAFTLGNATSNLSVGDEGTTSTTVVNEGPQPIRNAVVRLTTSNQDITVQQEEIAIGTLEAGETANVSFPVEVSDNAQPGTQQFSFVVEYDNQAGNPRESDTLDAQIEIEPEEDPFSVGQRALQLQDENASGNETEDDPLTPGGTKTVTVPITNNRDVTLRNIEAQAFTDDPLSLANDQAFISELGPGETANITFEVSASGDARLGTYPLSLDFQYETPDGDTRLSDTYDVPVRVEEAEGGILSSLGGEDGGVPIWLLILIVLLVAAVLGYLLYRQRESDEPEAGAAATGGSMSSFEPTRAADSGATTGSSRPADPSDSSGSTED